MRMPVCPGCKAKFSHDNVALCCKRCGLPDETAQRGLKAVQEWQRATGQPVRPVTGFQRARRKHGRQHKVPSGRKR